MRINLDSPAMHLAFGAGGEGPKGRVRKGEATEEEVEEGGRVAVQTVSDSTLLLYSY